MYPRCLATTSDEADLWITDGGRIVAEIPWVEWVKFTCEAEDVPTT
jgi:hypothetical protein